MQNVDFNEKSRTYIGYRILNKTAVDSEKTVMKVDFRITVFGGNAEKIADTIHFWKIIKK